jgi:hypothetical protein
LVPVAILPGTPDDLTRQIGGEVDPATARINAVVDRLTCRSLGLIHIMSPL